MSRITYQERALFNALHEDRANANKIFNQRAFRGIKPNVVDKYVETAHFIYELLQNADDANATEVTIILRADRLLFKHNGTKHFDITAEDDERIGDINSITGIGNSSKGTTQNKIGKFGVGFKAVFQYTDAPEIFDDPFKFRIEDLIVPTLLEYDYPERQEGETLFVIPFRNPQKSFDEIRKRLEALENPILFLRNLEKIVWCVDCIGKEKATTEYSKTLLENHKFGDITLEKYHLQNATHNDCIFIFSRDITITLVDGTKSILPIYIGFYYDEQNKSLNTKNTQNIYCFFPTKETFKTCFISHAPFLLTENRQNIKRDENLNKDLLHCLARLATDAVVTLRDYGQKNGNLLINENIIDIIPLYESRYYHSEEDLFEEPMKEAFNDLLESEPVLLSRNDKYLMVEDAYTSIKAVWELMTQEQFYFLRSHSTRLGRDDIVSRDIDFLKWELIVRLGKIEDENQIYRHIKEYTAEDLGNDISAEFMKTQKIDWVTKFYTFLRNDAPKYWKNTPQTRNTMHVFRSAPIIKLQSGKWVVPFTKATIPNVYLPIENNLSSNSDYNFISREYLKEDLACKFFNELEIKQPNEYDYIQNIVLKKYKKYKIDNIQLDDNVLKHDFELLLSYYKRIMDTDTEDEYIKMLKETLILKGTDNSMHKASDLYVETDFLSTYFGSNTVFFNKIFYRKSACDYKESFVNDFVIKLGGETNPIITEDVYYYELPSRFRKIVNTLVFYEFIRVVDYSLSGFEDACKSNRMTKDISVHLWNNVIPQYYRDYETAHINTRQKRKHYWDTTYVDSTYIYNLKERSWLYDKEGVLQRPRDIYLEDLSPSYNILNGLPERLGISKRTQDLREKYNATDEEQKNFEIGSKVQQEIDEDFTEEDLMTAIREAKAKKKQEKAVLQEAAKLQEQRPMTEAPDIFDDRKLVIQPERIEDKMKKWWEEKKNRHIGKPHSSTTNLDEIPFESSPGNNVLDNTEPFFAQQPTTPQNLNTSADDTARAEKNLKAKDTTAQSQAENAKDMVDILDLLKQTPEYTFKWFKVLMELMHAGQDKITERRVQIDFSRYEIICSDKVLHLIEPTQPIPIWVCDAEKYSITVLADGKTAKIDGLIVKTSDNSIDVSIEITDKMLTDLQNAKKIRVIATDNTNIINSLETRFLQLEKEDDFNMNDNLPTNLSFIYGPPGTGKTTELVKRIHNLIEQEPQAKILVLTPTNKAADVVAIKMSNDEVCEGGLARYGATESLYLIEDIACVTNRDTTYMDDVHNIVVATAARYAYDYVQPDDTAICDYPWDYIFIDEASMIDILTITYILYKGANAKQIIISGDPKQIQPVVQNDMPAYSIYNMVGLQGFSNAVFDYTRYPVDGLMMQHRSIPVIGNMISQFAYDGLVDCDPNRTPMKPLVLDGITIKNVNFVGFDVAELDDIKGLNEVNKSAFNLYSVIFTYNMIEYTIKQIEKHHPNQYYTIGVVCAYRAQSDAIKNMLENRLLDTTYCKVTCGTVHSFQGDECDIMFIVLNPPAVCTSGTHVNSENIINVAMSRARDYLFFILPNGQPKGFFMKNKIGAIVPPTERTILKCEDIEKIMFNGNSNFIYENTHVTCHMPINVYCEDEALYEVRMSENALDIKINQKFTCIL